MDRYDNAKREFGKTPVCPKCFSFHTGGNETVIIFACNSTVAVGDNGEIREETFSEGGRCAAIAKKRPVDIMNFTSYGYESPEKVPEELLL